MESPAEERVHRRAKQMAVSEVVNRKITKTMKIAKRGNRKAQDNLLHRRSQDKEVNEAGKIPLTRERMRRAGTLLQERVAEEQRLQKAAPAR